ncbi:MAG: hypothetical protein H6648_05570 [Caldilineae bacterium]|nr:hypothetical protein [Caldilineae bacterium]
MSHVLTRLLVRLVAVLVVSTLFWTHVDTAEAARGSNWVELNSLGGPMCDPEVTIRNVGRDAIKTVFVMFDARDTGQARPAPSKVECSGLIAPGGTWSSPNHVWLAGQQRAVIVSFTARQLSEIGVDVATLGFDDVVADFMCESLFFGVVGDRDDYDRFAAAFHAGGDFAGAPQDRAAGSPIVAHLDISGCGPQGVQVAPGLELVVPEDVLETAIAAPASIAGFGELRDESKPHSPYNPYRTCLVLQDSGRAYHPLHNSLVFRASCQ